MINLKELFEKYYYIIDDPMHHTEYTEAYFVSDSEELFNAIKQIPVNEVSSVTINNKSMLECIIILKDKQTLGKKIPLIIKNESISKYTTLHAIMNKLKEKYFKFNCFIIDEYPEATNELDTSTIFNLENVSSVVKVNKYLKINNADGRQLMCYRLDHNPELTYASSELTFKDEDFRDLKHILKYKHHY